MRSSSTPNHLEQLVREAHVLSSIKADIPNAWKILQDEIKRAKAAIPPEQLTSSDLTQVLTSSTLDPNNNPLTPNPHSAQPQTASSTATSNTALANNNNKDDNKNSNIQKINNNNNDNTNNSNSNNSNDTDDTDSTNNDNSDNTIDSNDNKTNTTNTTNSNNSDPISSTPSITSPSSTTAKKNETATSKGLVPVSSAANTNTSTALPSSSSNNLPNVSAPGNTSLAVSSGTVTSASLTIPPPPSSLPSTTNSSSITPTQSNPTATAAATAAAVAAVNAFADASHPPPPAAPRHPIRKRVKLRVPAEQYPDYNFVGRLLGPRGATLKRLERDTACRIMIRGKGSIRKDKEAEVRGKPGYEHVFHEPLHVVIEVADATDDASATRTLQRAKELVEMLLVPVPEERDSLKRAQLRDLAILNGTHRSVSDILGPPPSAPPPSLQHHHHHHPHHLTQQQGGPQTGQQTPTQGQPPQLQQQPNAALPVPIQAPSPTSLHHHLTTLGNAAITAAAASMSGITPVRSPPPQLASSPPPLRRSNSSLNAPTAPMYNPSDAYAAAFDHHQSNSFGRLSNPVNNNGNGLGNNGGGVGNLNHNSAAAALAAAANSFNRSSSAGGTNVPSLGGGGGNGATGPGGLGGGGVHGGFHSNPSASADSYLELTIPKLRIPTLDLDTLNETPTLSSPLPMPAASPTLVDPDYYPYPPTPNVLSVDHQSSLNAFASPMWSTTPRGSNANLGLPPRSPPPSGSLPPRSPPPISHSMGLDLNGNGNGLVGHKNHSGSGASFLLARQLTSPHDVASGRAPFSGRGDLQIPQQQLQHASQQLHESSFDPSFNNPNAPIPPNMSTGKISLGGGDEDFGSLTSQLNRANVASRMGAPHLSNNNINNNNNNPSIGSGSVVGSPPPSSPPGLHPPRLAMDEASAANASLTSSGQQQQGGNSNVNINVNNRTDQITNAGGGPVDNNQQQKDHISGVNNGENDNGNEGHDGFPNSESMLSNLFPVNNVNNNSTSLPTSTAPSSST